MANHDPHDEDLPPFDGLNPDDLLRPEGGLGTGGVIIKEGDSYRINFPEQLERAGVIDPDDYVFWGYDLEELAFVVTLERYKLKKNDRFYLFKTPTSGPSPRVVVPKEFFGEYEGAGEHQASLLHAHDDIRIADGDTDEPVLATDSRDDAVINDALDSDDSYAIIMSNPLSSIKLAWLLDQKDTLDRFGEEDAKRILGDAWQPLGEEDPEPQSSEVNSDDS